MELISSGNITVMYCKKIVNKIWYLMKYANMMKYDIFDSNENSEAFVP